MKFGITTPVVTLSPRTHNEWERDAGPAEIARIAVAADQLGYSHLTCSEHVGIPQSAVDTRGGRYYDPAATLGFVAALTENIRLLTHVVVLPYHHPLEVAKTYGTLDRLSNGRLILGVGVGSLEEEFDLLEVSFDNRGGRYEDALRAVRAAFGRRKPDYEGSHYSFRDFVIDPCSVQECPPLWLGGRTRRSLRRALELGDGWDPFRLDQDGLRATLEWARETSAWNERLEQARPFDIVLSPDPFKLESASDIEQARSIVRTYRSIGATVLNIRFVHRSAQHFEDLLSRFSESIASKDPS